MHANGSVWCSNVMNCSFEGYSKFSKFCNSKQLNSLNVFCLVLFIELQFWINTKWLNSMTHCMRQPLNRLHWIALLSNYRNRASSSNAHCFAQFRFIWNRLEGIFDKKSDYFFKMKQMLRFINHLFDLIDSIVSWNVINVCETYFRFEIVRNRFI